MALSTLGGKLLLVGGRLAQAIACCCNRWCRQTGEDQCGNPVYACDGQQQGSIGPCTEECRPPADPCECGPDVPCPLCYNCVDRKCERIEDCCADGSPCPACSKCVDGACVPCGPCEQCIDGECQPCGPCQKCEDGECTPCDSDEVCIGGVCVPKQYYCCWDSCADKQANTNNTTCTPANVSGSVQTDPCGEDNGTGGCGSLKKSGPFSSLQQCEPNCQRYACVPNACGVSECQPSPSGPYGTLSECSDACGDCSSPCSFAGANAAGVFAIDGCERDICVSYTSLNTKPIRVQILGPIVQSGCQVPSTSVIKADSGWRCNPGCDCPEDEPRSNDPGDCSGGPVGQITWTKPLGVTWFEVRVIEGCGEGAGSYLLDIRCSDQCPDLAEGCCGDCDECDVQAECTSTVLDPAINPCFEGPAVGVGFPNPLPRRWRWNAIAEGANALLDTFDYTFKNGFPVAGCRYVWLWQSRSKQKDNVGSCGEWRLRLYRVDCDGESLENVTQDAIADICAVGAGGPCTPATKNIGDWIEFEVDQGAPDCDDIGVEFPDWPAEPTLECPP